MQIAQQCKEKLTRRCQITQILSNLNKCDRCLQDLTRFVGSQVVVLRQQNCMQQALAASIETNTQCDY